MPNLEAVGAEIKVMDSWVKSGTGQQGEDNFAYSFVMLTKTGENYWAQVGPFERHGDVYMTVVQYSDIFEETHTYVFDAEPLGTSPRYKVDFVQTSAYYFRFFIDDENLMWAPADFAPDEAQVMGEINTMASQLPGESSAREHFTNALLQVNGQTMDFFGFEHRDRTEFRVDKVSTDHYDIWDTCE